MTINFEKVCRSCMAETDTMFSIFKPNYDDGLCLADLFNAFTNISASFDDGLPNKICNLCYAEIRRTTAFKHKTESCNAQLRQYLRSNGQKNDDFTASGPLESLVEQFKNEPAALTSTTEPITIKIELDPLTSVIRSAISNSEMAISTVERFDIEEKPIDGFDRNSYLDYDELGKTKKTGEATKTNKAKKTNLYKSAVKTLRKKHTKVAVSLECPNCKALFSRLCALQKHVRNQTCLAKLNKIRGYHCAHCPAVFTRREKITRHFAIHGFLPTYPCIYCRQEYDKVDMKEHLRLTHAASTLELDHLCQVCGKAFSLKNTLRLHMKRHEAKTFQCQICPYTCVSKTQLQDHASMHSGEHPFECSVCGHRSTTRSARARHMRIHTGEKKHACEFCPMRFSVPFTLKNHRRTHTGEKPYACGQCDRTFAQRSDCVSHQKTHIVGCLFKCKHCSRTFQRHSTLKVHMRTHSQMKQNRINVTTANTTIEMQRCSPTEIASVAYSCSGLM